MEKVVCEICDKSFKTNESLNQHKNVAHGQSVSAPTKRKRKLAKGKIIGVLVAVLIMSGIGYFSFTSITGRVVEPGIYDAFAQCLTENGAVFYGAY